MIESVNERMRLNAEVGAGGESCVSGREEEGGLGRLYSLAASLFYIQLYKDICYIYHVLYIKKVYFEYTIIFPGFLEKFQSQRDKYF